MVVMTHNHNSKLSSTNSPQPFLPQRLEKHQSNRSDHRNFFHLVTFLVIAAFTIKLIVEFKIHQNLRTNKYKPNHEIFLEEQHEVIEIYEENDPYASNEFNDVIEAFAPTIPGDSSLLNITDFKWIRNNASTCSGFPHIKIIAVLVLTSRNNFMERQIIRETYASVRNYKNWSVRPLFLTGVVRFGNLSESELLEERKLDEEHKKHGDVITGSFVDSYRNLTYKHMMGYKWILQHCPNASFVLKTDDDIFVDILHFIDMRNNSTALTNSPKSIADMYCYKYVGYKPSRLISFKWYVTREEWSEDSYPDYCNAWLYGITVEWINRLYLMSYQTKFFWVDDVFIGVLVNMASSFYNEEPKVESIVHLVTTNRGVYLEMCQNSTGNDQILMQATRKFGSIVTQARHDYNMTMNCLWRKTLLDKNITVT